MIMRKTLLSFIFLIPFQFYSQVEISEIMAYEYNNFKNNFTSNVVGKESIDIEGSGSQTLVVIKLNRIPNVDYKFIERKLKIIAYYEGKDKVDVYDEQEMILPHVSDTFFVPLIIQSGTTDITIKAELFEEETIVSTKKQFLVTWSGD